MISKRERLLITWYERGGGGGLAIYHGLSQGGGGGSGDLSRDKFIIIFFIKSIKFFLKNGENLIFLTNFLPKISKKPIIFIGFLVLRKITIFGLLKKFKKISKGTPFGIKKIRIYHVINRGGRGGVCRFITFYHKGERGGSKKADFFIT